MSVGRRSLSEIVDIWGSQPRPDRCKDTYLIDYLGDLGLLVYGYNPTDPDDNLELRGRNRDHVRLIKRTSTSPEGAYLPTLVSECVKGQYTGQRERFDGNGPDYQFVYQFPNDFGGHDPQLIERRQSDGVTTITLIVRLLDLISESVTQTTRERDGSLYDRHPCENYLRTANRVDDWGRNLLEDSLRQYLRHIENYQLLFDVHFCGRRGSGTTRWMTKQYNTHFDSQGQLRKTWTCYNSTLEHTHEKYDNAVLMTLTVGPGAYNDPTRPDPRSLYDGTSLIDPSFNRLLSYFDSDPLTKDGTRRNGVPSQLPALDDKVTGRPHYRLPCLKTPEFAEKNCAYLHVLMFDVLTRGNNRMSFLIDRTELERKWEDYDQGQVIDLYPLVFRGDPDEVRNFGTRALVDDDDDQPEAPVSKGFVDWHRYGDHNHNGEWVVKNARSHDLIEFYDNESGEDGDGRIQNRAAGTYLGKYLSATFGSPLEASESFEDTEESDSYADRATTWKLSLYRATGKQFWSVSRDIEKVIEKPKRLQDPDVQYAAREFSVDSLQLARNGMTVEELALDDVMTPSVESTLPGSTDFHCHIGYLGCYIYWGTPTAGATATDPEHVEGYITLGGQPEYPDVGSEKPPSVADVWG